ncbi:transmembrane protein UsgS [Paracoccidioides lutzii Pb01]|uniref:Transmembrane protein UsgS n=1 Tax=Paracoccidioides lutzii (strain ATCC MYA-826 / Pb01) TaxID=502779 RepID=C1GWY1_PARBA|nr:transmembrane protein UsgS [Paracoccidioides lutzii Pb01]EEH41069.2 transmembrane protein UsgS [Paracoccidioides lutzii Pb01]
MSNFEPNAIIRGAQLTLVGAHRALQNPSLFKSEHYRQAALAACAGIAIRLIISIPVIAVKFGIWLLSWIIDLEAATWDDIVLGRLDFISTYVLQVPFLLMTLMRYVTPTLDDIMYSTMSSKEPGGKGSLASSFKAFVTRYGRKTALSIAVYLLSLLPVIGRFVLPSASFYTFNKAVGTVPALVIFGSGLFVPRRFLVMFLQTYFSSRSLMRELLEPYFTRIKFTKSQKRLWFHDREGVLFGFAVGFYTMLRIPLLGVLMYGIAEASTAYLITKITDPPPQPAYVEGFAESQVRWRNKHAFLGLSLDSLDVYNVKAAGEGEGQGSDGKRI